MCDIVQRSCRDLYIDTYIYACIHCIWNIQIIYMYTTKSWSLSRDDREYRVEYWREEGIGGSGRRWEGCTVEIHSHSIVSTTSEWQNGTGEEGQRSQVNFGGIPCFWIPTACPLTANVLPENTRRIPDGTSQERKKTQEEGISRSWLRNLNQLLYIYIFI